jgi:phosphoglycolate phosphatase-like HAD superfamily hydrolase
MTETNSALALQRFTSRHEFLVALDSDGTVFDTMTVKHRECLCPCMIECFGLEPVAQAARECMDFSGLFSKTRGANRHKTLRRILGELLPSHPMVVHSGFDVPQLPHYFAWVDNPGNVLSGEGLQRAIAAATGDARRELELATAWNDRVNRYNERLAGGIPPFAFARECILRMHDRADLIVVSTAPCRTLAREWNAYGLARYAAVIAGQEMGEKARCIETAAQGRYNGDRVLMIGDAPGDLKAAKANDALFYPIDPGDEVASWKRFHDEAMDKFFNRTYAGRYERRLIAEFDSRLPEKPPWATRS